MNNEIGRIFFSNFSIMDDKENEQQGYKVEYKLKEPWDRLFKIGIVNVGVPNDIKPKLIYYIVDWWFLHLDYTFAPKNLDRDKCPRIEEFIY